MARAQDTHTFSNLGPLRVVISALYPCLRNNNNDIEEITMLTMKKKMMTIVTVVEIVYTKQIDLIDLDCSRNFSIVVNVSLLTLRHA